MPKSWDKQGPAFPFFPFQASLIYKEFKTHVKISIQRLNYILNGGLTILSFFYSQNNKASGVVFKKVFIIKYLVHITKKPTKPMYSLLS